MPAQLVDGLRIGHATDVAARTGCTVLLGPFRGAVSVRGLATGTRELDALSPTHLVPGIDAVLLTGGSAFGLAAADGVMRWLERAGVGFDVGVARVPIVPAAVIFDLGAGSATRRPDAALGEAACDDARAADVAEGAVGAGTGATVGKLLGPERASAGGLGIHTEHSTSGSISAVAVVNALGDVRGADGRIIAGARDASGAFADAEALLRNGALSGGRFGASAGTNTTLAAVVLDAPLTRAALQTVAHIAANALARRITPVNTPFDGDVVFALTTAPDTRELAPADLLSLGVRAGHALEQAIERGVAR
ncbi:MAG TPA: P1 family peptidase [Longimicrobiales bacterium]|nr:P1 family peptidase [Longimicrobiales bacterium]